MINTIYSINEKVYRENLGKLIWDKRTKLGISRDTLSKSLGIAISEDTIWNIEKGKYSSNGISIIRLILFLGISYEELSKL